MKNTIVLNDNEEIKFIKDEKIYTLKKSNKPNKLFDIIGDNYDHSTPTEEYAERVSEIKKKQNERNELSFLMIMVFIIFTCIYSVYITGSFDKLFIDLGLESLTAKPINLNTIPVK